MAEIKAICANIELINFILITKEVCVNSNVSVDNSCSTIQGVHQEGEEWQALNGDELAEDD